MKLYYKIVAIVSSLICLALILVFKTLPTGKLWNEYNILYVPVETPDSIVKASLQEAGIKDYVSLNNQFLPVTLNENSPEISLLKSNYSNPKYNYYTKRNAYFYDKSNSFRLYYIPNSYKNKISHCIKLLEDKNVSAGADTNSTYPWFLPVIVLALAGVLCFFSKNRIEFGISAILPVVFSFCNPFFSIAFADFILLLCLFFISNIWKRKGAISYILSNYYILILAAASVVCSFGSSLKSGFFYILCLIGTAGFVISYSIVEEYFESKKSFVPVLIKAAKHKSLFAQQAKTITGSLLFACLLSILLLFVTSSSSINSHFAKVLLPAPKGIESTELPDLNDYCDWMWNVKTAPYESLNKSNSITKEIVFPRFTEQNGVIKASYDKLTYNDAFKEAVYTDIDNLSFNAIEKVLKTEKTDYQGGYASSSSTAISIFGIIAMLFVLLMLLFLFISIMIGKGIVK